MTRKFIAAIAKPGGSGLPKTSLLSLTCEPFVGARGRRSHFDAVMLSELPDRDREHLPAA